MQLTIKYDDGTVIELLDTSSAHFATRAAEIELTTKMIEEIKSKGSHVVLFESVPAFSCTLSDNHPLKALKIVHDGMHEFLRSNGFTSIMAP